MSANDIYRIEEVGDGRFSLYHHDIEGFPAKPLVVGITLKEATRICTDDPAEYGYYIAWIDDRESDDLP